MMVGMDGNPYPEDRYGAADLDGKALVIIQRSPRGYGAVTSGTMRAVGDVDWLDARDGSFPITESDLHLVEAVAPLNQISFCQGFDFFMVQR